jgi:hypothetical protein
MTEPSEDSPTPDPIETPEGAFDDAFRALDELRSTPLLIDAEGAVESLDENGARAAFDFVRRRAAECEILEMGGDATLRLVGAAVRRALDEIAEEQESLRGRVDEIERNADLSAAGRQKQRQSVEDLARAEIEAILERCAETVRVGVAAREKALRGLVAPTSTPEVPSEFEVLGRKVERLELAIATSRLDDADFSRVAIELISRGDPRGLAMAELASLSRDSLLGRRLALVAKGHAQEHRTRAAVEWLRGSPARLHAAAELKLLAEAKTKGERLRKFISRDPLAPPILPQGFAD